MPVLHANDSNPTIMIQVPRLNNNYCFFALKIGMDHLTTCALTMRQRL